MPEQDLKCSQPTRGPIIPPATPGDAASETVTPSEEVLTMIARVGKPAPDFEAMAYQTGGFKPVRLSDYDGKWRLLCFYPGDFTFV